MDHTTSFPTALDTAALRQRVATTVRQSDAQPPAPHDFPAPHLLSTEPLTLPAEIDALVQPRHRLIDSPSRMAPEQLQLFLNGTPALRLAFPDHTVHPAVLQSLHPTFLVAETQQAMLQPRLGDLVLALFPVAPQLQYVIQTVIQARSAFQLHLAYGDPRYDVRYRVHPPLPGTLTVVPPSLIPALRGHHTRIVRDCYGRSTTTFPQEGGTLSERLSPPAPAMPGGRDAAVHVSQLHDISLGGVCLALPVTLQIADLSSRLLYLDLLLPEAGAAGLPLRLQLFGLIRGLRIAPAPGTLHLRFLKRLPAALDAYFAALT